MSLFQQIRGPNLCYKHVQCPCLKCYFMYKSTNCQTVVSGWKFIVLSELICVIFCRLPLDPDRREDKWLWERGMGFPWWKTWVVRCYIDYNSLACLSTSEPENAITPQDTKEDTDDVKMTSGERHCIRFNTFCLVEKKRPSRRSSRVKAGLS